VNQYGGSQWPSKVSLDFIWMNRACELKVGMEWLEDYEIFSFSSFHYLVKIYFHFEINDQTLQVIVFILEFSNF